MGRYERFDPVVRAKARRSYRRMARNYDFRGPRRRMQFGALVAIAFGLTFGLVYAAPELPQWANSGPAMAADPRLATAWTGQFEFCGSGPRIDCVVDGDTFWIGGEKVRIADIGTPELHPARCADEERRGEAAKHRLYELLNGGEVALHRADARDRDHYGRLLRNASVDGRDVGAVLIDEGLARPYAGGRRPWC